MPADNAANDDAADLMEELGRQDIEIEDAIERSAATPSPGAAKVSAGVESATTRGVVYHSEGLGAASAAPAPATPLQVSS